MLAATVTPFTPKGEVAQWRLVYDEMRAMEIGQVLTYDRLTDILGQDFIENRGPYFIALRYLEANDARSFKNQRNKGYRMVEAVEHESLAVGHHKKAKRSLKRAISKVHSADRSRLSIEERQRFDAMEMTLGRQADAIRTLQRRQDRMQSVLEETKVETQATRQSQTELEERLARLEGLLATSQGITV